MKYVVTRTIIETQTINEDRPEDALTAALDYGRQHDWQMRVVLSVEQVVG